MRERGRFPADDDLGARIESALRSGLDTDPVDVGSLASSTRRGIRRAQVRRRVAASGALVAAVVAAVVISSGGGSVLGARHLQPAEPTGTTHTPAPVKPPGIKLKGTTLVVPESVGLIQTDFPTPWMRPEPISTATTATNMATVGTVQACPTENGRTSSPVPEQVASRVWEWNEGSIQDLGLRADVTVTVWKKGTGHAHFRELVRNTGACTFDRTPQPQTSGRMPGDESWVATVGTGLDAAAVRFGDVIIGIDVIDPARPAEGLTVVRRLVAVSAERLAAANSLPVPSHSATSTPDYFSVAYPIPDAVFPRSGDLPSGVSLDADSGQYRWQPTVEGQSCAQAGEKGPAPVAGRRQWWRTGGPDGYANGLSVAIDVTGWARGTGAARFKDLADNTGLCQFSPDVHLRHTLGSLRTKDDLWTGMTDGCGTTCTVSEAVRSGDVIASVQIFDPRGTKAAQDLARNVLDLMARRLAAASLGPLTPTLTPTSATSAFYGDWGFHTTGFHVDPNGAGSALLPAGGSGTGAQVTEKDTFTYSLSRDGSVLTFTVTSVSWSAAAGNASPTTVPSSQHSSRIGDRYEMRFVAPGIVTVTSVQGSGHLDMPVLCGKGVRQSDQARCGA